MTQTLKKVLIVLRIFKYDPALDSPDDNMVQGPGCIYAGLAWYSLIINKFNIMSIFHQRYILSNVLGTSFEQGPNMFESSCNTLATKCSVLARIQTVTST